MRLIFTTILFLVGWQLNAQQCNEKQILTGPQGSYVAGVLSPSNPENPTNASYFNWMLNPTVDGVQFRFTPVNGTTKYILSPWHISDPQIDYYNMAKGTNSDYKPSDGWEVFKVNLGRLNDDVTIRLVPTVVPYIMLYNRYTGTLRVFGYLDRPSDYHQMVITLSYTLPSQNNGLKVSALLSLNDNVHQTLDMKTSIGQVKAVTKYSNNQYLFFWADFPMAYDPCACLSKSNLTMDFKAVQSADVKLTGTIIGNVVPIAADPSNVGTVAKFMSSALNIAKGIYTGNFTDLASSLSSIFGITGLSLEYGEGLDILLNSIQLGLSLDQISNAGSSNNTNEKGSQKEQTQKILTAITTYFSALGKSRGSGSMSLTASALLTGKSITEYSFGNTGVRFSTPGSQDSHLNPQENYNNIMDAYGNVRPEYVTYNEILGTFALLKKPVINMSYQRTSVESCGCDPYNRIYVQTDRIRFQIPKTYIEAGIQKNNSILYALNPIMHTNLNNTKIKVALVFKDKMGANCGGQRGIYNNDPLINLAPLTSTYPNLTQIIVPVSYDGGYSIDHNEVSWEGGVNNNTEYNCKTYEFMTPLVPLNFIYDLNGQISLFNTYWEEWGIDVPGSSPIDEVLLKFYVDFESNDIGSNGQPNKSTLIFTYPVQINLIPEFSVPGDIDLTQTRPNIPPVTQSQLNQFCTTQLENATYQAKELIPSRFTKPENQTEDETETIRELSFNIMPNPSSGIININYQIDNETPVVIRIHNMQMQKVTNDISLGKKIRGSYTQKLELNSLSPGMYLVSIVTSAKTLTCKLIIRN